MKGFSAAINEYSIQVSKTPLLKTILELSLIVFFIVGACIAEIISIGMLLILVALMIYKIEWTVKGTALLSCISVMNPYIVNIGERFQTIKWLVLFFAAFIIILNLLFHEKQKDGQKINLKWVGALGIYVMYLLTSSLLFSSLPLISVFKILSFLVGVFIIFVGMQLTKDKVDWMHWMSLLLGVMVLGSLYLINSNLGYIKTTVSFQGLMAHPNSFGPLAALFIVILLIQLAESKSRNYLLLLPIIALAVYELLRSLSRTSTLAVIIGAIALFVFKKDKKKYGFYLFIVLPIVVLIGLLFFNSVGGVITDFFYKGSTDTVLDSRLSLYTKLISEYAHNPLFGSGFGTPKLPNRSYMFAMSYPNEQGNILLAVLAESGIIGMALFIPWLKQLIFPEGFIRSGWIALPVYAFCICMGEMVFFSTNGLGVFMWIAMGLFCTKESIVTGEG